MTNCFNLKRCNLSRSSSKTWSLPTTVYQLPWLVLLSAILFTTSLIYWPQAGGRSPRAILISFFIMCSSFAASVPVSVSSAYWLNAAIQPIQVQQRYMGLSMLSILMEVNSVFLHLRKISRNFDIKSGLIYNSIVALNFITLLAFRVAVSLNKFKTVRPWAQINICRRKYLSGHFKTGDFRSRTKWSSGCLPSTEVEFLMLSSTSVSHHK